MIVLKPTIIGFSASYLFFHGEGMMVLKPTIIGLPAIYPLSPWERVRERAKRKTQETSSEKDGNTNTHYPNHQKKNIKNNCCQIRFRRPLPTKTGTRRLKSDFPDTSN